MALSSSPSRTWAMQLMWSVLALVVTSALAFHTPAVAQAADPHAGHAMGGMVMAGMTPPPPMSPPLGPVVTIDAGSQIAPMAVSGSPGQISVVFPHPVTITSLMLTNAVGQQIPIHMTLPADPVQSVRIPIVIQLQPGAYKVAWRIADQIAPGEGSSSFAVQLPDGSDPAPPALHHHH